MFVDASAWTAVILNEPEAEAFEGDCFAYACARAHNVPLLYRGGDFALTDIEAA